MTSAEPGACPTATSTRSRVPQGWSTPCVAAPLQALGIDALGRAPQRELAQREQIALPEEALHGALGLRRDVDLALPEALQQLVRREIDELDLVGPVDDRVGDRLAHDDAGDRGHDVVQALDVLHVERRVDVDAGVQQLLDVLPAPRVARARRRWCAPARRAGSAPAGAAAPRRGRTPGASSRGSRPAAAAGARARRSAPRSPAGRASRPSPARRRRPRAAAPAALCSIA